MHATLNSTLLCKELQDKQIERTMQQSAALTLLDGAPATILGSYSAPSSADRTGHRAAAGLFPT
jgi:hypothetical protein